MWTFMFVCTHPYMFTCVAHVCVCIFVYVYVDRYMCVVRFMWYVLYGVWWGMGCEVCGLSVLCCVRFTVSMEYVLIAMCNVWGVWCSVCTVQCTVCLNSVGVHACLAPSINCKSHIVQHTHTDHRIHYIYCTSIHTHIY